MHVNPDFVAFWETTDLPWTDFGPVDRFALATQAAYLAAEMGRFGRGGLGSGRNESGLATTMERATSFLGVSGRVPAQRTGIGSVGGRAAVEKKTRGLLSLWGGSHSVFWACTDHKRRSTNYLKIPYG
jgi:hypothetical protein